MPAPEAARPAPALDGLERWMQEVITHAEGVRAGAASGAARAALATTIAAEVLPSVSLSAEERIGVYAGMYFDRLVEVLEQEFAGLTALLGHQAAHALFHDYVVAHPSRHYSLNMLGARLPGYLETRSDVSAFAAELAQLERTLQEAFDAPRSTRLTTDELLAVPPERWAEARLEPIPALALLAFQYPVDAWFRAWRQEDRAGPAPAPAASWLAVYRSEDRVWRLPLSPAAHALLAALVAGETLGGAVVRAAEASGTGLDSLGPLVRDWFRAWTADGLFARVTLPA